MDRKAHFLRLVAVIIQAWLRSTVLHFAALPTTTAIDMRTSLAIDAERKYKMQIKHLSCTVCWIN